MKVEVEEELQVFNSEHGSGVHHRPPLNIITDPICVSVVGKMLQYGHEIVLLCTCFSPSHSSSAML